jgi:hypothetical protein
MRQLYHETLIALFSGNFAENIFIDELILAPILFRAETLFSDETLLKILLALLPFCCQISR